LDTVADKTNWATQALKGQLIEMGLTEGQVNELLTVYGLMPDQITTTIETAKDQQTLDTINDRLTADCYSWRVKRALVVLATGMLCLAGCGGDGGGGDNDDVDIPSQPQLVNTYTEQQCDINCQSGAMEPVCLVHGVYSNGADRIIKTYFGWCD